MNTSLLDPTSHGQYYDWLNFFLGGAFGSLVILGIERAWNWLEMEEKWEAEQTYLGDALDKELKHNLLRCRKLIDLLDANLNDSLLILELDDLRLERFMSSCIDYTNKNSLELVDLLQAVKNFLKQFTILQNIQINAHGLMGVKEGFVSKNNLRLKGILRDLEYLMRMILHLRSGQEIQPEEVDNYFENNPLPQGTHITPRPSSKQ